MRARMATAWARVVVVVLGISGTAAAVGPTQDPTAPSVGQPGAVEQRPAPMQLAPAQADTAAHPPADKPSEEPPKLPWHDTWLIVDNSVTAQTVGLGKSFQSSNPTYDLVASLRPRFYFYETETDAFYVSGRIDATREFTNNDVTTERGETVVGGAPHGLGASDPTLFSVYRRVLAQRGSYQTLLAGYAPVLTFPLSKFSRDNGNYLGLGTEVRFYHDVPLAGPRSAAFKKLTMGALLSYNHMFTRATTPTNTQLFRVRMDPEGRTVPGDQLEGAAFPEHEVRVTARFIVEITKDFSWWTDFAYQPTWLYGFSNVNVCTVTPTPTSAGVCAPAARPANVSTFVTLTEFETSLFYHVMNELTVGIDYANVALQPGVDGQRRNIFYSPGALISLELIGHLDEIYLTAAGRRSTESSMNH
jgi:hypothetical protein